jgi:K(+)-stimulated pyrophosphate-energized sodium pump
LTKPLYLNTTIFVNISKGVLEIIYDFVIIVSTIGILSAMLFFTNVLKQNPGNKKMQEISKKIHDGAMTFLSKEYKLITLFVAVATIALVFLVNNKTAISFVLGAVSSMIAGFVGMNIATRANSRTTQAAEKSLSHALRIAFKSGQVTSLTCVSVGLAGVTILYMIFRDPQIIFGYSFGASSVALFARVGGGIFTKAADMGADLVGKVEENIPEDDPRNPAVIADNVGDNVGDVAGMGADLFESYVGCIIAAMAIGLMTIGPKAAEFSLVLGAIGIIASIIGGFFVRENELTEPEEAFQKGLLMTSLLVAVMGFFFTLLMLKSINIYYSILIGLGTGILIGYNTSVYTSEKDKYVKSIAQSAKTGPATEILQGLVVGMKSTRNIIIVLALAIFFSFQLAGMYGIAIAAVAMMSTLGVSLAIDTFGSVADNAGGIAEMAKLPHKVRKVTDRLDAAGNMTAAMGKGFAIGAAAFTAIALFTSFIAAAGIKAIDIAEPRILMGAIIGGMLPFFFASLAIGSVEKAAYKMVEEVRRQFKTIKGIMKGKAEGDYKRCIEISSHAALSEMMIPGLLAIASPLVMGILFGADAVGGLLAGALITGVPMAIMMANAGGAWDNAKKLYEAKSRHGKDWKGEHIASVIGDTVGDPLKDTAGPSLNILIKLMSIVALIFVALFSFPLF